MSNLRRVRDAMATVAWNYSLNGMPTTHRQPSLALIEGISHELAHVLDLGRNFERRLSRLPPGPPGSARFEVRDRFANEHEESALRIEVAALAALGVHVSLRNLWRDAAWRGEPPRFVERDPTARQQKCVAAFARIVRKEMP